MIMVKLYLMVLTFHLAFHEILEEVDGHSLVAGQVSLAVHRQEVKALLLAVEFVTELLGSDSDLLAAFSIY